MIKRIVLLAIAAGFCMGVSCTIVPPGGGSGGGDDTVSIPLDEATATITIRQAVGGTSATVVMTLVDSGGRTVELSDVRSVEVNDETLTGPDSAGEYSATIDAASEYTITVREPTRGVERTTVNAPADFAITSDADVSLAGFALMWSNADEALDVKIELDQASPPVTEEFGPYADTGQRTFTATQLREFGYPSSLTVTVTKIATDGVNGFGASTITLEVSTEQDGTTTG